MIFNDNCDCTKKGFDRERNMAQIIFVLLMVHDFFCQKDEKSKGGRLSSEIARPETAGGNILIPTSPRLPEQSLRWGLLPG